MTTSTDPIADMLTRIRNAIAVSKTEVLLPHSSLKQTIANVLLESNFIDRVEVLEDGFRKQLKIVINQEDTNPRISTIERVSTPGRRMYASVKEIPRVKQGRGIVIVSTSRGMMTGDQARRERLGGELICRVY